MVQPVAIGIDDFRTLRELGLAYVDKSDLIRQLLDRPGVQVALFPRPRRFGKTLNLSMLRCWFEKRDEDLSHLFQDLSVWQTGERCRAHFQRYPVIHLTFKGARSERFDHCVSFLREKIIELYKEHRAVLDGGRLDEVDVRRYRQILDGSAGRPDVLVRPRRPGEPGAVLELKVARRGRKTLDQALAEGLLQLETKDYAAELRAAGAAPVHAFAAAFDGKKVRVAAAGGSRIVRAPARAKAGARPRANAKKTAAPAKKAAVAKRAAPRR